MTDSNEIEYIPKDDGKKKRNWKKFWEDHYEAIITGAVGFACNVATGYVAIKMINGRTADTAKVVVCPSVPDGDFPEEAFYYPLDVIVTQRNGDKLHTHLNPSRVRSPEQIMALQEAKKNLALPAPAPATPDLSVVE